MSVLNSGIRENLSTTLVNLPIEDDHSPLLVYVVWIFVAYLTYPVIPPYLHLFGNEDTIFDPSITINHFYSFWKATSLSYGGRITLLKSVLGALPTYYFSLFKAQCLRRNLILGGVEDKVKIYWRAKTNPDAFWFKTIKALHKNSRSDSFLPLKLSNGGVWKVICSIDVDLHKFGINLADLFTTDPVFEITMNWNKAVPIKTNFLVWRALINRLPTIDNLQSRGYMVVESKDKPRCFWFKTIEALHKNSRSDSFLPLKLSNGGVWKVICSIDVDLHKFGINLADLFTVKKTKKRTKIGIKPDKNGKRVEAEKSLKQLQLKEEEKPKKTKKEWSKTHTRIKSYSTLKERRKEKGQKCNSSKIQPQWPVLPTSQSCGAQGRFMQRYI
nr:hypothetical protein [Tanacetum cinerariifolium]